MIRNFADKDAEKIWGGAPSRRLPASIQSVARRKLRMLANASVLEDLRIPPANRLEALKGQRKGRHASGSTINGVSASDGLTVTPTTWKSSITTDISESIMKSLPNIHPGEVLLEEFLTPLGISQNALARAAGVPPRRINEIVLGKRGVTADTAVRLALALGTSERFWLGLQADFDLEEAHRALGKTVDQIERIAA